jgi:predicted aspartyl protease
VFGYVEQDEEILYTAAPMTSIVPKSRRPDITFTQSGCIELSARVVRALGIEAGDVIDIGREGREHYLYVAIRAADKVGRHRCEVRRVMRGERTSRVYSVAHCRYFLADGQEKVSLPVGEVTEVGGYKAMPIIVGWGMQVPP